MERLSVIVLIAIAAFFAETVLGAQMRITVGNPPQGVSTVQKDDAYMLRCSESGPTVYSLTLSMLTPRLDSVTGNTVYDQETEIAFFGRPPGVTQFHANAPSSLRSRAEIIDYSISDVSNVDFGINVTKADCSDVAKYRCSASTSSGQSTPSDLSLAVTGASSLISIQPDNMNNNINCNSQIADSAVECQRCSQMVVEIRQPVTITCRANVDTSDRSLKIYWYKETGYVNSLIRERLELNVTQPTIPSNTGQQQQCATSQRTGSIEYWPESSDYQLMISCEIGQSTTNFPSKDDNNYWQQLNAYQGEWDRAWRQNISLCVTGLSDTTDNPQQSGDTESSDLAGIIAGGVIGGIAVIVLVVVLVYFLWYRKRNNSNKGETYRTDEPKTTTEPYTVDKPYDNNDYNYKNDYQVEADDEKPRKVYHNPALVQDEDEFDNDADSRPRGRDPIGSAV